METETKKEIDIKELKKAVSALCRIAFLLPYGLFFHAFLLYKIWGWFIFNVININLTYQQSIGVDIFFSLVFMVNESYFDLKSKYVENHKISAILTRDLLFLLIAYLIHLLVNN